MKEKLMTYKGLLDGEISDHQPSHKHKGRNGAKKRPNLKKSDVVKKPASGSGGFEQQSKEGTKPLGRGKR